MHNRTPSLYRSHFPRYFIHIHQIWDLRTCSTTVNTTNTVLQVYYSRVVVHGFINLCYSLLRATLLCYGLVYSMAIVGTYGSSLWVARDGPFCIVTRLNTNMGNPTQYNPLRLTLLCDSLLTKYNIAHPTRLTLRTTITVDTFIIESLVVFSSCVVTYIFIN